MAPHWARTTNSSHHHNMVGVRPCSTNADPGPNSAKRPRLQLDQPAQWDLKRPMQASTWQGQHEFSPSCQFGSALLAMPRDLIVIQPGSFSASGQVPDGAIPSVSPSAENYAPWANWTPQGSMLEPLSHSPLQPLSPSPPSHQEQHPLSPVRPTPPPCKAKRRLLF